MIMGSNVRTCVACGFLATICGFTLSAGNDRSQPLIPYPSDNWFDVSGCVLCHYSSNQHGARRFRENFKSHEYVKLNEGFVWEKRDPHSFPYKVIVPNESNPIAIR